MNISNLSLILLIFTNLFISTSCGHASSQDAENNDPSTIEPVKKRAKISSRSTSFTELPPPVSLGATNSNAIFSSIPSENSTSSTSTRNPVVYTIPKDLPPYQNLFQELKDIDQLILQTAVSKGTSGYLGNLYATMLKLYIGNWIEWLYLDNLTKSLKKFIAYTLGDLIKDDFKELNELVTQNSDTFESPKELFTAAYLAGCTQLLAHTQIYQETTDELNQTNVKFGFASLSDDVVIATKRWLENRVFGDATNANTYDYNAATLLFVILENPIVLGSRKQNNNDFPETDENDIVDSRLIDHRLQGQLIDLSLNKNHRGILANNLQMKVAFDEHDPADDLLYLERHMRLAQKLIDLDHPAGHIFMGQLWGDKATVSEQTEQESADSYAQALTHYLRAYELRYPDAYGQLSRIYNGILLDDQFYDPKTSFKVLDEGASLGLNITPFFLIHTLINLHDCPASGVEKILKMIVETNPLNTPKAQYIKRLMELRLYAEDPTKYWSPKLIEDLSTLARIVTADDIQRILVMDEVMPIDALLKTTYFMIWKAYDNASQVPGANMPDITETKALQALINAARFGHRTAVAELQDLEKVSGIMVNGQNYLPVRDIPCALTQPRFMNATTPQEFLKLQLEQTKERTQHTRKLNVYSALSFAMGLDESFTETHNSHPQNTSQLTILPIRSQHLGFCFEYAYAVKRLKEISAAPQVVVNLHTMQNDPYKHLYAQTESVPMTEASWLTLQTNLSNLLEMDEREKNLSKRFFNFLENDPAAVSLKSRLEKVYKQLLPMAELGKKRALACVLMLDGGQACVNRALEALSHVESELAKEVSPEFNSTLPLFIAKVLAQLRSRTAADIDLLPVHDQNVEERRYYRIILEPFISPEVREPNLQYHQAAITCYGPTYAYTHFLDKLTASLYIEEAHSALKTKLKLIASHLESNPPVDLKEKLDQAKTPVEKQRLIWDYFSTDDCDDVRKDFIEKLLLDLNYLSADPYY